MVSKVICFTLNVLKTVKKTKINIIQNSRNIVVEIVVV